MKLTRQKLKSLLTESLLIHTSGRAASAAMLVRDPRQLFVFVDTSDKSYITISIGTVGNEDVVGSIEIAPVDGCDKGVYNVSDVDAREGYGPLLYDIAIFYASRYSYGLVATTLMSTNQYSQKIWKYYYDNRLLQFDTYSLYDLCPNAPQPRNDTSGIIKPSDPRYKALTTVYNSNKDKSLIRFLRKYGKIKKFKFYSS